VEATRLSELADKLADEAERRVSLRVRAVGRRWGDDYEGDLEQGSGI
jgi:hypothetical protein